MEIDVNGKTVIIGTKAAYLPGVAAAITTSKDFFYEDKDIQAKPLSVDDKNEIKLRVKLKYKLIFSA